METMGNLEFAAWGSEADRRKALQGQQAAPGRLLQLRKRHSICCECENRAVLSCANGASDAGL
jgi:hypothetical protein